MILDDGGDATGLMLGSKAEQDITVLNNLQTKKRLPVRLDQEKAGPRPCSIPAPKLKSGCDRGDHHRVTSLQDAKAENCPSRYQCQRFGYQASSTTFTGAGVTGGQHQACYRRDGGRQAGFSDRLRRCGQGFGLVTTRTRCHSLHCGSGSDLRAASCHGGYRVVRLEDVVEDGHLRNSHRQLPGNQETNTL